MFYFTLVGAFGEIHDDIYSSIKENTVFTSDTTLYCVTENKVTPQIKWSYVDLAGTKSSLISTTDANTGVSILQVYSTDIGSYSCEVTENGGSSRTYTAIMININSQTGIVY